MNQLDDLDIRLIEATGSGLPLVEAPYAAVADVIGTTEADVIARFRRLLENGIIRRIGVAPNHYKLGVRANGMTVWDVDDERASELGRLVGNLEFVSHCYLRPRHLPEWPYNLFAMVHAETRADTERMRTTIRELLGNACRASDVLYSTRILKKTGLRLARRET